jgi:hypothetical protein
MSEASFSAETCREGCGNEIHCLDCRLCGDCHATGSMCKDCREDICPKDVNAWQLNDSENPNLKSWLCYDCQHNYPESHEFFEADFVPLNQEYWCSWCGDNEKSSLPQNCINYHYHYQRDNPSCGNKMCVTCYNQHEGRCYPCEEKEQAAESFNAEYCEECSYREHDACPIIEGCPCCDNTRRAMMDAESFNAEGLDFTPFENTKSGKRILMNISQEDMANFDKLPSHRNEQTITIKNLKNGKKYVVRRADCGAGCYCAAEVVRILKPREKTFNAPYAGAGALMPIKGDTALSSFSGKELAESSAIHGDFNQASLNYSGHQNLEVRGAETDEEKCSKCENVFDESEYFPIECVVCEQEVCKECSSYQRDENDEWDWDKPTCFDCLYPDQEAESFSAPIEGYWGQTVDSLIKDLEMFKRNYSGDMPVVVRDGIGWSGVGNYDVSFQEFQTTPDKLGADEHDTDRDEIRESEDKIDALAIVKTHYEPAYVSRFGAESFAVEATEHHEIVLEVESELRGLHKALDIVHRTQREGLHIATAEYEINKEIEFVEGVLAEITEDDFDGGSFGAESFSAESRDELIDTLIEIRQELAKKEGMEDWENESEGPLDSLSSGFIQELIWWVDGDRDTWNTESFGAESTMWCVCKDCGLEQEVQGDGWRLLSGITLCPDCKTSHMDDYGFPVICDDCGVEANLEADNWGLHSGVVVCENCAQSEKYEYLFDAESFGAESQKLGIIYRIDRDNKTSDILAVLPSYAEGKKAMIYLFKSALEEYSEDQEESLMSFTEGKKQFEWYESRSKKKKHLDFSHPTGYDDIIVLQEHRMETLIDVYDMINEDKFSAETFNAESFGAEYGKRQRFGNRYVGRDTKGKFISNVSVGRSLKADRRNKSKTPARSGFGHRGDIQKGGVRGFTLPSDTKRMIGMGAVLGGILAYWESKA